MTVLVAGTFRVPPEHLAAFLPHMSRMLKASRTEPGCLVYSYAEDVLEPGLIRVFEAWRDQASLDAHFQAPHMAEWRAAWPGAGANERKLIAYDVTRETAL